MSRTFTREELYELVWSRPMTHLAREFGLSDVGLHKICRKHEVPNPPPGWWAKKAAGRKVRQTPLPKGKGVPEKVVIAGGELRAEPASVKQVREQARITASSAAPEQSLGRYLIVERTIAKLRKAKPGPTGLVESEGTGLVRCAIAPASVDRLATALPPIIAAAAQQGFVLESGESAARLAGAEETIAFSISERVKRVKHELADGEKAGEEKWQQKRERHRPDRWRETYFSRPRFPEWEWQPTGLLCLELEEVYVPGGSSPRRSFRDGKVQRLENMTSDIAVGMAVLAATKKERRLKREAEQRRIEEQRRLRDEALRATHVEERRTAALESVLDELDRVERLRRLLGALRDESGSAGARVAEFMRWSEDHLTRRVSGLNAEGLTSRFLDQGLFGEDDGHAFRPPHW